jgi:hypothetical protein
VPQSPPGPARLAIRKIVWQSDDWPRADFPSPIQPGDYRLRIQLDNLYVAVRNESTDPLTEAHFAAPNGFYNIQNVGTGFYADDVNGLKLSGDFLREWWPVALDTNEAQQWRIVTLGNGAYEIQNVRSGRVFDDFAFGTTVGNPIWLWDWLYGVNQVFYFEPVP